MQNSVFISYSHKDSKWLSEVRKRLSILEYNHEIISWDDTRIKVGSNWKNDITQSIKNCKVAILLISNDFLDSAFIVKQELPAILKAASKEGLIIFNIIIDFCNFNLTALSAFQCLNDPQLPLEELKSPDRKRVLVNLTNKLLSAINESETKAAPQKDPAVIDDIHLYSIPILGLIIKHDALPITEIQNFSSVRRKTVVESLDLLRERGYVTKLQGEYKKKPSSLWKASESGKKAYSQFITIFSKITH
jgi:hypothetical protein